MKPKLRFKEFTDDWEEKKLGEVSEITSSKRVFQQEWTNEGIPFYRARDLISLQKNQILSDPLYISLETYLNKIKVSGEINKDDILVTGVGSLGVPYLVKINDKFYFKDGNILWIKNIVSNSLYTYYYFLTSKVQRHIKMEAVGSTVGTFTIQTAKQLKFKFPSLPEQEKIGTFLSSVDRRIEKQEQKVALLEEEKKGYVQQIFNQELRFKDEEGNDYPDWGEKKFKEILSYIGNGFVGTVTNYYVEKDNPEAQRYIVGANIRPNKIDLSSQESYINKEFREKFPKAQIKLNDMLMVQSGHIGTCCVVNESIQDLYCHALIINRFQKGYNSIFISQFINSEKGKKRLSLILTGSTIKHINVKDLKNLIIPIPSLPEQEKIANFLSLLDQRIEKEQEKLRLLKEEKKGLLQQMFV